MIEVRSQQQDKPRDVINITEYSAHPVYRRFTIWPSKEDDFLSAVANINNYSKNTLLTKLKLYVSNLKN